MAKKEEQKETAIEREEAAAVKEVLDLLDKAKLISSGIASEKLEDAFTKIPRILDQSRRVDKARSMVQSNLFGECELTPFLRNFSLGISEVTFKFQKKIGIDEYLDIRGILADYMVGESAYGACEGTYYKLDLLFESHPKIDESKAISQQGYREIRIFISIGLKMFLEIAPKLSASERK